MKTAIVTGASAGLGREIVRQIAAVFPEIEAYWLIARRAERLEELAAAMPDQQVDCMPLDLCDPMSFMTLQEKLASEQPEVALLVNNAGCGYLGNVGEVETSTQTRMIDLNLRALTAVTNITVPFMAPGSRILNVSLPSTAVSQMCMSLERLKFTQITEQKSRLSGNLRKKFLAFWVCQERDTGS